MHRDQRGHAVGVAAPAPKVSVAPGLTVVAPKVMRPTPGLNVTLFSIVVGEFKEIADAVALIWLALIEMPEEAFAVTPPKRLKISL